jgi:NAD(P)-dependent dehydrogenase (short-subunit alcohol dehydrogenase family)
MLKLFVSKRILSPEGTFENMGATRQCLQTLHPIQRLATVDEIVDAVLYLAHAASVTGEVLHVDGGAHAGRW